MNGSTDDAPDQARNRQARTVPPSTLSLLCTALVLGACATGELAAQERPVNPDLGLLMGGIRVQLRIRGADSTEWFTGRITQTAAGCTFIQLVDGRWRNRRLVPDTAVAASDRVAAPLWRVRSMLTGPLGVSPADSSAWRAVDLDRLLAGEPAQCDR
jgi:hypothetical protein